MSEFWQRLQNEIKANRKQAGLLAGLFLFGCCFWVPMVARAVSPKRASAAVSHAAAAQIPQAAASFEPPAASASSTDFWRNLASSLADDPLFQPANVSRLMRDPFQLEEISEPLPVLFAEEPRPMATPKAEAKQPVPLELNSTIISRLRRAALINGQLYPVGRRFKAGGREYVLTSVETHQVVLSSGEKTIVLTLDRPGLKDVLSRSESIGSPVQ